MPKHFYIIDGHAQIFRAYYAPFGNLSAPSGEPTRATHVFCQQLFNLARNYRPDYLAMVLDVSDETLERKRIYPEYKSHREPAPEDFPIQERRIIEIVQAIGIPILRLEGWEADDLMATLVRRHASPELKLHLVSRDKDLDQLLSENVELYDPLKDEHITHDRLLELKGWTPQQAIDAQTLIGDTVDNVPGVAGIGPKTAAKLLQKYGSARAVIEHADELTPRQRENVLAFAPRMELTRQLVTLRDDAPIEFDLESACPSRFRWSAARPIMQQLGFRRLVEQVPEDGEAAGAAPPAAVPPGPAGEGAASAPSARASQDALLEAHADALRDREYMPAGGAYAPRFDLERARELREPDIGAWKLVSSAEELDRVMGALAEQPVFCVDTETTSVSPIDADLVGVALSWKIGEGWYIPVRSIYSPVMPIEWVRRALGPILADARRVKVGHNIKYDLIVLRQAGMPAAGPYFDTMIAAFVLDPLQTSYKLDTLVAKYIGHTMIPISDLIGKGRDQLTMDQAPLEQIAEYAAEDADYTWRMRELLEPALRASDLRGLFFDTEMPLVEVLTEMEFNGIRIDTQVLGELNQRLAARTRAIEDEIAAIHPERFNIDSPKQLAEVLFDKLGMRVVRRTKTARSTDAETLEALAAETGHPLPRLILEYRELQKLRGTYLEALPREISRRTGRVHTSFHQTGAVTGRLSSSEPNLQNIPVRTELGREIRRAFTARSAEEQLIVADYSQIELRVLAHFCGDEALIQAFREDRDIHAFVAAQVNGVPLEAVTREMRSNAKAVNFGIIYGQTAHGLAQSTGMSRTDAQKFIDDYFRRYPRIRAFIEQCAADARREGCVRTILGRRRPIPDINSRNSAARAQAERLSVNTVIQGSAADLIKTAMIRLHRRTVDEKLPLRMLLQVHDELVLEAPRARAREMAALVAEVMGGAMALRVPLKVDAHVCDNWLEAK